MKSIIHSALLITAVFASTAWAETATINFAGTITGPTCSLATSNITIPIGNVNKSVFTGVGTFSHWSPNVPLVPVNCNASLISMTFRGTANASNSQLFAVTGGASGVGIQLQKSFTSGTAQQAIPNDTTEPVTFTQADVTQFGGYSFAARYVQSDATVTPGSANATITVLITYT